MKTKVLITLAFFLVLLGVAIPAQAVPYLDFNMDAIHPAGASISYAGGAAPLVGANIGVDSVVGIGTPSNAGVLQAITGGLLSFTTGNLTAWDATHWYFGGGSGTTITVTGGIAGLGIPNGSTLLSGTWTSAEVTNFTGTTWAIVLGSFVDTKNDTLVTYYGLPTVTNNYTGIINLTFTTSAVVVPPAAFSTGSVLSGDVTNQPVPEPSIILLMGAGLIGIWGFSKRIIKR